MSRATGGAGQAYGPARAAADKITGEFPGVHARPVPVRGGGWGISVSDRTGSALVADSPDDARAWAAAHAPAGEGGPVPGPSPAGHDEPARTDTDT